MAIESLSDQLAESLSAPAPVAEPAPAEPQTESTDPAPESAKPAPAAEPAKPPAPTEEAKGAAYARIAKQEREARERAAKAKAELDTERARLDAEKQALANERAANKEIADLVAKAKAGDPQGLLDLMQAAQWDPAKLSAWKLSGQKPEAVQAKQVESLVDQKLKEMAAELAAMKKAGEEKDKKLAQQQIEAEVKTAKGQLSSFIDGSPKYQLLKAAGEAEKVFDAIFEVWQKTGQAPTFAEACDLAEASLEKQAEALLGTEKMKAKYAAVKPAAATEPPKDLDREAFVQDFGKTWEPKVRVKVPAEAEPKKPTEGGLGTLGGSLPAPPPKPKDAARPGLPQSSPTKTRQQLIDEIAVAFGSKPST